MEMEPIEKMAEVFNGKTPSKKEQRESGFPVLKIRDVAEDGTFRGSFSSFVDEDLVQNFEKKIVQNGDILLLNAAHNSEYVGSKNSFANSDMEGALATGEWTIIRPNQNIVFPKYLYFCINSPHVRHDIRNIVKGIHLYPKDLKKICIPLPTLEEQKRIVSLLDEVDAMRCKRKEAMELLDQYVQSVFLEMFGDPVTNSKGMKTIKISEVGKVVTGNTPSRADKENYGSYIEWIKSDNINNDNCIATKAREWLSEEGAKQGRLVPSGSILVTCIAGSKSCIGNCSLVDRDVAFNQQINAIVPNNSIEPFFLYMQVFLAKKLFQRAGTNGMKGLLSKSKFSEIELLKPDFEQQKLFAEKFLVSENIKQKMLAQHHEINTQFDAMMQEVFTVK